MSDASTTYSRRQFVRYQHLIDGGASSDADEALAAYARRFPERDLDQPMTFAQWLSEGNSEQRFARA